MGEDRLAEERRRRRLEILAKYKEQKPLDHPPKPIETKKPEPKPESRPRAPPKPEAVLDMFGDDFEEGEEIAPIKRPENPTLAGNWDNNEGYYEFIPGEMIKEYLTISLLGKGVFSTVIKAIIKSKPVAIKIIRNNDLMAKVSQKEIKILNEVQHENIVKIVESFKYNNHMCIVFELEEMTLRQFIKKSKLQHHTLNSYTKQILHGLSYIHKLGLIHCDLKPDNILVSSDFKSLKIGDFGSCCYESEVEPTPYLVSRFYRAPEIILGCLWTRAIDMWSLGCILYELYSGKVLFSGRSNNLMIFEIMKLCGKIPARVIKKGTLSLDYFVDQEFIKKDLDQITGKPSVSRVEVNSIKPQSLKELIGIDDDARSKEFCSLIQQCLCLLPEKRISAKDALSSLFFKI